VDEIVVGDTGSTDRTVQIARDYGARVFSFPWGNNFSEARNRIIRQARSDWILSIDADERLDGFCRDDFENTLSEKDIYAIKSMLHPKLDWTPLKIMRLFRNDPRIFFENIIHETVGPSVEKLSDGKKQSTPELPFSLIHLGYDHESEEKHRRYLPLLHEQLLLTPEKTYFHHHLGTVYRELGDDDNAIDFWQKGIAVAQRKRDLSILDAYPFIDYITYLQDNRRPARYLVNSALDLFPLHPDLLWLNSRELFREREYDEAIRNLQTLITIGEEKTYDRHISYYSKMFTELAYDLIGMCYLNRKEYRESAQWFRKALDASQNTREYYAKMKIAEAQGG
jgi:glycosyltransferase involved in cell wall biosynthesis